MHSPISTGYASFFSQIQNSTVSATAETGAGAATYQLFSVHMIFLSWFGQDRGQAPG